MRILLLIILLSFGLNTASGQFLYGGGATIEWNDWAPGVQVRVQYELHENFIVSAKAQYYLCCGNFFMYNADLIGDIAEIGKRSEIRYFVGLNLFPGKSFDLLGVKYRGKLLYGANIGLEYYTKVFSQHFNVSLKFIYGKGYHDFGLTTTMLF